VYSVLWQSRLTILAVALALPCAAIRADEPVRAALRLRIGTAYPAIRSTGASGTRSWRAGDVGVVILDGAMTTQRRERLSRAGLMPIAYLPDNGWIVRAERAGDPAMSLEAIDSIRWVGAYERGWKFDPEIGQRAFVTPERRALAAAGRLALVVTLFPGESRTDALRAVDGVVVHEACTIAGGLTLALSAPAASLAALGALPGVQFIEEAPELTSRSNSATRWVVQSNQVNVTPFYDRGLTGSDQIVGLIDGRINVQHCSFLDAINPIGPAHRKIVAYNALPGYDQHGTHVAGIAVGDAGANDNTRGVAYGARLAFSTIPAYSEVGIFNRLSTHHAQGARIHSNSWGDDTTTAYNGLCRGIDDFVWQNEDDLVVFAVSPLPTVRNPENAKNLLAVGSTNGPPNQDSICSGGAGPTADGRRKPELFAPGCGIQSSSGNGLSCLTATLSGPSMSAPAVAGTAALVRQYYRDGYYPGGTANPADGFTPSAALLKATLLNSAADLPGAAGYPSDAEGWGRVWLGRGPHFAGDSRRLIVRDVRNALGLETGDHIVETLQVHDGAVPLKITLAWTDPPATAGAAWAAVNDLDLEVVAPGGTTYLGNRFVAGESTAGGDPDPVNNVEMMLRNNPPTGAWTMRVRGSAVNVGRQGFALVVNGAATPWLPVPVPTAVDPNSGARNSVLPEVRITGVNFRLGARVLFSRPGQSQIEATQIRVRSPNELTCRVDLTGAEAGLWSVTVCNDEIQSGSLADSFDVLAACRSADLNDDGLVNGEDITPFVRAVLTGQATPSEICAGDLGLPRDGLLSAADVPGFVGCLLGVERP